MVRILFVFFLPLFLIFNSIPAQARLDILPNKVVMDPRDRSAEVTVINLFDQPSLYRVSLLNYRQNADGTYTTLDTPLNPNFDPATAVRYSPRQFQLPPGGRQKIRISLRKPNDLPEGEYRFHLLATRFEVDKPGAVTKNGVDLKMNVGVAIPVVVQHGAVQTGGQIMTTKIVPQEDNPSKQDMEVTIARSGNGSAVGQLAIYQNDAGGNPQRIGFISNFNVFSENTQRMIAVPLRWDPRGRGPVRLVYTDINGNVYDDKQKNF